MLEFILAIPENIGWVIVGVVGTLTAMMLLKVGKVIAIAIKDRLEDEDADYSASFFSVSLVAAAKRFSYNYSLW